MMERVQLNEVDRSPLEGSAGPGAPAPPPGKERDGAYAERPIEGHLKGKGSTDHREDGDLAGDIADNPPSGEMNGEGSAADQLETKMKRKSHAESLMDDLDKDLEDDPENLDERAGMRGIDGDEVDELAPEADDPLLGRVNEKAAVKRPGAEADDAEEPGELADVHPKVAGGFKVELRKNLVKQN
jgi:hypothetical protein